MSEEESGEKSHKPSQRKLEQARKKGEVARSADLITAASYGCFLLVLMATGATATLSIGESMSVVLAQAHTLSDTIFSGNAEPILAQLLVEFGRPILPWICLPPLAAIGMIFVQKAFVLAPSKLVPRLSKISPIANAKNKFGAGGLFEFFKSFVKLSLFSGCLGVFLWGQFSAVAESLLYSPSNQLALLGKLALQFLLIVVSVMLAIGGVDFLWQRQHHLQKNRMTHKEVRDEHKDSEGDPHMKQQRRARAQEVSSRQIVAEVKSADVVIVNPTHFAVALKWSREASNAPVCVAKGIDAVALQIREVARENGVPIHSDPPTARALFASVDLGEQIQETHFRAVAVAIRFSEEMRKKARRWQ